MERSLSQLPRLLLAAEHRTAPPFPSPAATSSPLSSFHPSIAVIIGVLSAMFALTFLLLLYAKHCARHVGAAGGLPSSSAAGGDRRNSGVSRSIINSLPVFRFGSLTGRQKDGLECAVCLSRFEQDEILRLLPKCKHGFHVECVDVWLEAHSTCPLCRVRVDPEDLLLVLDPRPEIKGGGGGGGCGDATDAAAVSLPFVRRFSGRHSSAGERKYKGGGGSGCFEKTRKDGMLLTEPPVAAVEREEFERRFSHRIVVLGGDGTRGGRWSDCKPLDLLQLRAEMILRGRDVNSLRNVSEISGVSRFKPKHTGWWQSNGANA